MAVTGAESAKARIRPAKGNLIIEITPSSVADFGYPIVLASVRPATGAAPSRIDMPYSKYLPGQMGSIKLLTPGPFVAGSYAELVLVYTAGTFGIDDTGMMKVSWRPTSDLGKPQFGKPDAPNFTTVEASNGQTGGLVRSPQHPALRQHAADPRHAR